MYRPELDNQDSPNRFVDTIENVNPTQLRGVCFTGLDLGKQVDHSILAIVQLTETNNVSLIRKRQFPLGTPYHEVMAYSVKAHQTFNCMYVDKAVRGDAVVDELDNIGIPEVKGAFFTDAEKDLAIELKKKRGYVQ